MATVKGNMKGNRWNSPIKGARGVLPALRGALLLTLLVAACVVLFATMPSKTQEPSAPRTRNAEREKTYEDSSGSRVLLERFLTTEDLVPAEASRPTWEFVDNLIAMTTSNNIESKTGHKAVNLISQYEEQIESLNEEAQQLRSRVTSMEVAHVNTCKELTRRIQEDVLAAKRKSLRFFKERFALLQHIKQKGGNTGILQ